MTNASSHETCAHDGARSTLGEFASLCLASLSVELDAVEVD